MSTETQTISTEAPATSTGADDFTPEERAYIDSRGEKPFTAEPAPTTEPARTSQPQAEADTSDDPDGTISIDSNGLKRDTKTGRFVPHGAFHAARERAKAAESKLNEQAIELARARERIEIFTKAMQGADEKPAQAQQQETPPPDPEKDIFGYVKWQADQLAKVQKELAEARASTTKSIEQIQTETAVKSELAAFHSKQPDIAPALMHLEKAIDAELQLMGWTDPKERLAELNRLEREQVAIARKNGRNVGEHFYTLATMRGYQSKPIDPKSEQAAANNDVLKQLQRLENGQNAARSLSGAGGNAPAQLTVDAVMGMSSEELGALLEKRVGKYGNKNVAFEQLLSELSR